MAHKDNGVILGEHQSRDESHPRWYRETLFIENGIYWLCCEGGPQSRYECNDGRPDNIPIEPEHAINWLETNGCEEAADRLLAISRNGWCAVNNQTFTYHCECGEFFTVRSSKPIRDEENFVVFCPKCGQGRQGKSRRPVSQANIKEEMERFK